MTAGQQLFMPDAGFTRFGKYEIQVELGRGGFGRVFRAFDPTVGRLVAIKILTSEAGTDLLTRFRNEATAAGNLRHENIVTIYEFGEVKGVPFIAMEHLEGEDLHHALASGRPMTLLDKVSIMTQTAAGLDCAHRHGVVHRDVKPANIRLLPDGTVKIMDFGIARLIRDAGGARLTRQGHVLGTLLYMAPEQVMGSDTDALCDVFAYGVTFYELLTGRHPFEAKDPRAVFYKITSEDPEPIHHLVPDCPETLDHVIRRALQKDRELRYQTLRDLRVDVDPVLIDLRKERASTLVIEAHRLVNEGSIELARSPLNEAIDLDPANQDARRLRDTVQAELRRRQLRPRIDALLVKADLSSEQGDYADAVDSLEAALRLDPHDAALQARSQEAQRLRDQSRESKQLVSEARADFAQGNLSEALRKVSDAIALNGKNTDARSLLESVQLAIGKREWQQRLDEKLHQARELLLLNSVDDAIAVIDGMDAEQREAPEAQELLARLTAQKAEFTRQERLRGELASARELVEQSRVIDAVQLLQSLRAEFPGETRVDGLLSYAQQELAARERAQAIASLQGQVLACAEQKRFDEAIELLRSAMNTYPAETSIFRLRDTVLQAKTSWERQRAVEVTVRRCEALADQNQFDQALAELSESFTKYPDEPAFAELRRRLEIDRDRFLRAQAIAQALRSSDAALNEGRPEVAVAELETALSEYPDERLQEALARARTALEARERARLIERLEQDVRVYLEGHDFDRAFRSIEDASGILLDEPALDRLRESTQRAKAAWEKNQAIAAAERQAQTLRLQNRIDEAITSVSECLQQFPDSSRLVRLDADLRKEREHQLRTAAIQTTLDEAQSIANSGDLARAVKVLEEASARFPGESTILEALAAAQERSRKQERDKAIAAAVVRAREFVDACEFDQALKTIESVAASSHDPMLDNLRAEIIAERNKWRRVQDIAVAERQILEFCSKERFAEAIRLAEKALTAFPKESSLQAALRTAEEGWERQKRAESIRRAVHDGESLLSTGEPRKAIELLKAALMRHGSTEAIQSVLTRAEEALRARSHADAIQVAIQAADQKVREQNPSEAVSLLESAASNHGSSSELDGALERARQAERDLKRRLEYEASLKRVVEYLEDLISTGNLAEAGRALQNAIRDFPGEPAIVSVQQRLRNEWDQQRRSEATRRAADNGRVLLDQGHPERAVQLLEAAAAKYPDDPVIQDALARARKSQGERQQARVVEAVCQETRSYLDEKNFEEALKTVEMNLDRFGDEKLLELRATIIAAQRDFEQGNAGETVALSPKEIVHERKDALTSSPARPTKWRKVTVASIVGALAITGLLIGTRALRPGLETAVLDVDTQPAGAAVTVGQHSCITPECHLQVPAGDYRVEARLQGYAPASEALAIRKNEPAQVRLVLAPLPTSLVVTSNFASGSVSLNGKSAGTLRDGQLELTGVPPGLHQLKISSPDGEASFRFKTSHARQPELDGEIVARDTDAIVVTSLGSSVRSACSGCDGAMLVDGKPLSGTTLANGSHELTVRTTSGQTQQALFRNLDSPAITVHLNSTASPMGALMIETNLDGVSISIDRRRLSKQTEGGRVVIPLEPRDYTIEAYKPGYRVTPERLTAKIRSREQVRVSFRLEPTNGMVVLAGAQESATVLIDGRPAGTVRSGGFSVAISPGAHTIGLSREGFQTASTQRTFQPGETVRIDGSALRLEPLPQAPKLQPQPPAPKMQPQPSVEEIETGEWNAVRSGRDAAAIQVFLQKHPNSLRRMEAQQLLAQLEWDALDKNNRSLLERFAAGHRGTPLAQQALTEIARIDREAASAVTNKVEEQASVDRAEISKALATYAAAFDRKDLSLLKSVWPNLPEAALAQVFRGKGDIRSQLRPLGPVELAGDRGTVRCARVTEQVTQFGRQKPVEETRTVRLRRDSGRWVIYAID